MQFVKLQYNWKIPLSRLFQRLQCFKFQRLLCFQVLETVVSNRNKLKHKLFLIKNRIVSSGSLFWNKQIKRNNPHCNNHIVYFLRLNKTALYKLGFLINTRVRTLGSLCTQKPLLFYAKKKQRERNKVLF